MKLRVGLMVTFLPVAAACASFGSSGEDDTSTVEAGAGEGGGGVTDGDGAPSDGGFSPGAITTVVKEPSGTAFVAVDSESIFWWSRANFAIEKVDKSNPTKVITLAKRMNEKVSALAVDGSGAYWLESGPDDSDGAINSRIMMLPRGGPTPRAIYTTNESLAQLVVTSSRVVTTTGHTLAGVTKATNVPFDIMLSLDQLALATDGTDAFYTFAQSTVFRFTTSNGSQKVVDALPQPRQLTLESNQMYGIESASNGANAIFRADTSAPSTATAATIATLAGGTTYLTIDTTGLLVANAATATIRRFTRSGVPGPMVATGVDALNAIAADVQGVYWSTDTGVIGWAHP